MTKAERTRRYIIEKAAPIINRKGMAGTSISDIMEATQLAKGGVYGNFESKEEICAEALDYLLRKVSAAIEAKLATKHSYGDKLFALLDYYKGSLKIPGFSGCPLLNFGTEADDTNPLIKQKVSKAIAYSQQRIASMISAGIAAGEFAKELDAGLFALKAFAMIEGALWMSHVQGNNRQLRIVTDLLKKEIMAHSL
ncbi:TetR/AcrR family transcriptional regulator [Chitinophaga japonensis]|uniref:TetR family transcriptional regulator n=1 Tax=Chitinophaga japonensis TaxID=104662 RepID=A0A562T6I3_CHIJA|nr:TetR/AcrR family transcriptional regulator [Chitinophaga japonensis]TWI88610.1 TetR family transcriptional regulator [Chitinophaga japonensis]